MESQSTPAKSSALRRWGLVGLALLPCLVSLGFHVVGPEASPSAPAAERPALAFDQYAVNLGPIPPISHARGWFRFTNLSDRAVKVTNLKPSCGCLQPKLEKRDYAPGETGQFFVNVATAGEQPGPHDYTITVEYEDPEPQSVVLTFSMELPPRQVYITPRALLVYMFGGEALEKEIVVTDNRQHPLTVTGAETPAEFLDVKVAGTATEESVQKTRIAVNVSPVPVGRHNTHVKVFTNDPDFPVLNVPVVVQRELSLPRPSQPAKETP